MCMPVPGDRWQRSLQTALMLSRQSTTARRGRPEHIVLQIGTDDRVQAVYAGIRHNLPQTLRQRHKLHRPGVGVAMAVNDVQRGAVARPPGLQGRALLAAHGCTPGSAHTNDGLIRFPKTNPQKLVCDSAPRSLDSFT